MVYIVYGIAELALALVMLKTLERDQPVVTELNFIKAYKEPLTNYRFMRLVTTIFFVGFCVFGSFTYSGQLLQEITGYNILVVGLILSLFGVGTVVGGRIAPKLKQVLKHGFLVSAGLIGGIALFALSAYKNVWILGIGLIGFGIAFIFLQSTLIATAQEKLPKMKGTAMSLASFNMFVGGAVGTSFNGMVMQKYGVSTIFYNASYIILIVGILAALFTARFEMRKNKALTAKQTQMEGFIMNNRGEDNV